MRWRDMNKLLKRILALLGVIFMVGFAIVFTIGLYTNFKNITNALSITFGMLGLMLWLLVYMDTRKQNDNEEIKNIIKDGAEAESEADLESNAQENETLQDSQLKERDTATDENNN